MSEQAAGENRRCGNDRRDPARAALGNTIDSRAAGDGERRRVARRTADIPSLSCPDCLGLLRYESELSWNLPGAYTVDAGFCPSCARRFLRNRETGDYDALSW
jgi:hypothetical protein